MTIKHKIMVVDDDEVLRTMMKQLLESSGFICEIARDGLEALKIASEYNPDLVILDVSMPNLDGYETCRMLREKDKNMEIPIIFLSAKAELEDRIYGFKMGADDYVTKPFSYDELHARIKSSLRKLDRLKTEKRKTDTLKKKLKKSV